MEILGSILVSLLFVAFIVISILLIRNQEKTNQRIVSYWKAMAAALQEIAHKEDK